MLISRKRPRLRVRLSASACGIKKIGQVHILQSMTESVAVNEAAIVDNTRFEDYAVQSMLSTQYLFPFRRWVCSTTDSLVQREKNKEKYNDML